MGACAPACVLRNTLAGPTPDETEASTKGVRSSTARVTLHGEALRVPHQQPQKAPLVDSRLLFKLIYYKVYSKIKNPPPVALGW
jgi:hypothetical protein